MDVELDLVVVKVLLHRLAIDVENVHVHDGQAATPLLVAVGEIGSAGVEDIVDEGEVVLDLLVTFDVEAVRSLVDCSLKIRHDEWQ